MRLRLKQKQQRRVKRKPKNFSRRTASFLSGSEEEEVLNTVLEDTQVQSWYSQGGLSLQLKLADGEDTSRSVTGTVSLKAGKRFWIRTEIPFIRKIRRSPLPTPLRGTRHTILGKISDIPASTI